MSDTSPNNRLNHRLPLIILLLLGVFGTALFFYRRKNNSSPLPLPPPDRYAEMVSAFYTGTIALIVQEPKRAEANLKRATEIVPEEPAAWANLGLAYLRQPAQNEEAKRCLEKARSLAPDNGEIQALLGHLENKQGKIPEAIVHFRRAVELNPKNLFARYALSELILRQREPNYESEYQQQIEGVLTVEPRNLKALMELIRIAAQRKDTGTVDRTVTLLEAEATQWTPPQKTAFERMKTEVKNGNLTAVPGRVTGITIVLVKDPVFRRDSSTLRPSDNTIGVPMERFLRLPSPSPTAAAADTALTFKDEPVVEGEGKKSVLARYLVLSPEVTLPIAQNFRIPNRPEGKGSLLVARADALQITTDGKTVNLPLPTGKNANALSQNSIAFGDFNYDFRIDIVAAGSSGLRLFIQGNDGTFRDDTAKTKLPSAIVNASLYGVWIADIDLDGDLDMVVGQQDAGTLILQNNGDGTLMPLKTFDEVKALRGFAWADVDGDGDSDAALLDQTGKLFIYVNERSGQFVARPLPPEIGTVAAVTAGDLDRDNLTDFIVVQTNGVMTRLSDKSDGSAWEIGELARFEGDVDNEAVGNRHLFIADLDNNGGLDLVLSSPGVGKVWLGGANGEFQLLATPITAGVTEIADMNADGKFDLLALDAEGKLVRKINASTKNYKWVELRPRAQFVNPEDSGDNRINTFGIGGEVEVRSQLLVQKQIITGATIHFGLGENEEANFARFVWPNGLVQGEFELKNGQQITSIQRLQGSCPWLFTWDGTKMQFVTDCIWRSPLGLRINAQDTASVAATEDWVKIRGDQLKPKDGFYDIRITAELWETHFFDYFSLMVVDHPVGTEIYVDERFVMPPPVFKVFKTSPPQPIIRAIDDNGDDVTASVRTRDGNYLDTFGRGQYQGVTRPHYVEIELPQEVARRKEVYLIANGWIHPTDSSINVAISQGSHLPPESLQLELPDGKGGWKVAKPNLGFPSGKIKTIMIDLTGIFAAQIARNPGEKLRMRLRTNMEIYWDCLQWVVGLPETKINTQRVSPSTAELWYRGFSAVGQKNPSSPELPDYSTIQTRAQSWRDLIGYHTRFGDVMELVKKVEDRYVIMNAGDELTLKFAAMPPPAPGWVRDYILVADGWEKDGNYNTTFSKTVLPLPSHRQIEYTTPPRELEDDSVYRRYPQDWQNYHTRYVTPEPFRNALRPRVQN